MKQILVDYIHSQNNGWIYRLRVFHGHVHMWLLNIQLQMLTACTRKRNAVVATAFAGRKYSDNPKFILEAIHKMSPSTELIWLKSQGSTYTCPSYIRVVPFQFASEMLKELGSASVLICNDDSFQMMKKGGRRLWITTWHGGLGFKKIGLDEAHYAEEHTAWRRTLQKRNAYDFYISNSKFLTKVYRSAFAYSGPVWRCGYPSEDELLTEHGEHEKVRQKYHVDVNTKILLYVPTFRDKRGWQSKLTPQRITEAMQKRFGGTWVLAVHWHYYQKREKMLLPGAIDVTDYPEVQELIKASDAAISDYSSTLFHAVQRGIPCFVYADDYNEYKVERDFYIPMEEQPFPFARTEQELLDNIASYDKAVWAEKWQQYRIRTGHIVTGHSAEDVARVCVDFLNGKPKAEIMKEIPFETEY